MHSRLFNVLLQGGYVHLIKMASYSIARAWKFIIVQKMLTIDCSIASNEVRKNYPWEFSLRLIAVLTVTP